MITVIPRAFSENELVYVPANCTPEMLEPLTVAVRAYAMLNDPLASLLTQRERDEIMARRDGTFHLLTHTGLFLIDGNLAPSTTRWMTNISELATKLIETNYSQDWIGSEHALKYAPVSDQHDLDFLFHPQRLDRKTHWPLFMQAAMAQEWIRAADDHALAGGQYDVAAYEFAAAVVSGATDRLARAYPQLGESAHDEYVPVCTTPTEARQHWFENILTAASKFEASRKIKIRL